MNYEMKLDHINNYEMLQSNATIKYDENKIAVVDVGLKRVRQFCYLESE